MTNKQLIAIVKSILPELPGFAIKGPLMFIPPVEGVLCGLSFEGSSFDKTSIYVDIFVMPLCVPTTHFYFNFGSRLRKNNGSDRWSVENPNFNVELALALNHQAVPFLSRVNSLIDFIEMAKSFSGNTHTAKAIAFSLARAGQTSQSIEILNQLLSQLDLNIAWQLEIADQAKTLRSKLLTNPTEARHQLETWEAETLHNLGLAEFVTKSITLLH
jgi:hypothetical protein